jgi:hypothetical protein
MNQTITAAYLPGNSTAELRTVASPEARLCRSADWHEGFDHLRIGYPLNASCAGNCIRRI